MLNARIKHRIRAFRRHTRPGRGLGYGNAARLEIARLAAIRRRARNYKNSGNEAKKYLKTKDITFLNAANYARFARQLAQIAR